MLLGELDLDSGPALSALGKVDTKFAGTTGGMMKLGNVGGAALAGLAAAGAALVGVFAGFKDVMDLGGTLNDLSLRTGESVGSLVILREAFDEAGLGAEGVEPFFAKLQDSIAGLNEDGKSTATALEKLGTSAEELRNLSGIGQIEKLQAGFAGIADQAERVAVARDLLGKSGASALSLLGDPEVLDDARRRAGPIADIMEKNATSFDKLGDVVGSLKLNFQEFFAGALSKIAPEATSIADKLASIDFAGIGESFGELGNAMIGAIEPAVAAVQALVDGFNAANKAAAGLGDWLFGITPEQRARLDAAEKSQREAEAAKRKKSPLAKAAEEGSGFGEVGALQKIGLGGRFALGGVDPILSESQRHTTLLQRLVDLQSRPIGGNTMLDPVPV